MPAQWVWDGKFCEPCCCSMWWLQCLLGDCLLTHIKNTVKNTVFMYNIHTLFNFFYFILYILFIFYLCFVFSFVCFFILFCNNIFIYELNVLFWFGLYFAWLFVFCFCFAHLGFVLFFYLFVGLVLFFVLLGFFVFVCFAWLCFIALFVLFCLWQSWIYIKVWSSFRSTDPFWKNPYNGLLIDVSPHLNGIGIANNSKHRSQKHRPVICSARSERTWSQSACKRHPVICSNSVTLNECLFNWWPLVAIYQSHSSAISLD